MPRVEFQLGSVRPLRNRHPARAQPNRKGAPPLFLDCLNHVTPAIKCGENISGTMSSKSIAKPRQSGCNSLAVDYYFEEAIAADDPARLAELQALRDVRGD